MVIKVILLVIKVTLMVSLAVIKVTLIKLLLALPHKHSGTKLKKKASDTLRGEKKERGKIDTF